MRPVFTIPVTELCNYKCPWCIVDHNRTQPKLKLNTTAQKEDYIRLANAPDIQEVHLTGGEPLLFVKEVKDYIRRINKKINIYTNTTLLTPELVEFFNQHNVGIRLSIHVDGYKSIDRLKRASRYKDGILSIINGINDLCINNVVLFNRPFAEECFILHDTFNVKYIALSPDYTTMSLWTKDTVRFLKAELDKLKGADWVSLNVSDDKFCDCAAKTTFYTVDGKMYRSAFSADGAIYGCIAMRNAIGDKLYNMYATLTSNHRRRQQCHCPI